MATKKHTDTPLTDRVIAWFHLDQETCGLSDATRDYLIHAAIGIEHTLEKEGVTLTPILEIRVIDVLTQAMTAREMQNAITQDGVVIEEIPGTQHSIADKAAPAHKRQSTNPIESCVPGISDGESSAAPTPPARKLNPMVEQQAKCWDRLRKATDTYEKSFADAKASSNRPGKWTELCIKGKGIIEDALEYEKKRLAKLKKQGKLPPPPPGGPIPPELVGKVAPFGPIPEIYLERDRLEKRAAQGDAEAQKKLDEMPWPPRDSP